MSIIDHIVNNFWQTTPQIVILGFILLQFNEYIFIRYCGFLFLGMAALESIIYIYFIFKNHSN